MKLGFVQLEVPKELLQKLKKQGFSIQEFSQLPPNPQTLDVIVIRPGNRSQVEKWPSLRETFPQAWILWMVNASQVKDPAFQLSLMERKDKDAVCLEDHWEELFHFSLQQALDARRNQVAYDSLSQEHAVLKSLFEEMSEHSHKLIQQLERDVDLASRIQRKLLPNRSPEVPDIQLAVKFIPALAGGGDYYDIFEMGDRRQLAILLADSDSHGMAAALLSVLLKVRLDEFKERFPDSAAFVSYIGSELNALPADERAPLSLFFGILNRQTLELHYTSNGRINPLLWRQGKDVPLPHKEASPLGSGNPVEIQQEAFSLRPGDRLILYTNGLERPLSHSGKNARKVVVQRLNAGRENQDSRDLQNEVLALLDKYQDNHSLPDDITLIQLSVDAKALYLTKKA